MTEVPRLRPEVEQFQQYDLNLEDNDKVSQSCRPISSSQTLERSVDMINRFA